MQPSIFESTTRSRGKNENGNAISSHRRKLEMYGGGKIVRGTNDFHSAGVFTREP